MKGRCWMKHFRIDIYVSVTTDSVFVVISYWDKIITQIDKIGYANWKHLLADFGKTIMLAENAYIMVHTS